MGGPHVLYHFSENPHIDIFVPRQKSNRRDMPPVVWAIDAAHEVSFYVPRNCPRIICYRTLEMSGEDAAQFFGTSCADVVMTVESGWLDAIRSTTLYRYGFAEDDGFELFDANAGYYVTERTVVPLEVVALDRLSDRILATGAELRFTPSLHPLREALLASSFRGFGIHRFEFAAPANSEAGPVDW
jgi:hypothetical protein